MQAFDDLKELLDWIKTRDYVWYQAPLDHCAVCATVRRYTVDNDKPERSRAVLWTAVSRSFSVNLKDHFARFRKPGSAHSFSGQGTAVMGDLR